jgi:hypothetical protein
MKILRCFRSGMPGVGCFAVAVGLIWIGLVPGTAISAPISQALRNEKALFGAFLGQSESTDPARAEATRKQVVVELGFSPSGLALSRDGKTAVVGQFSQTMYASPVSPPSRIALIDLDSASLIASREYTKTTPRVVVDGQTVFVVTSGPDLIEALQPSKGRLESVRRVFATNPVQRLDLLPDGSLLVIDNKVSVLSGKDLKAMKDSRPAFGLPLGEEINTINQRGFTADSLYYRLKDGCVIAGRVVDVNDEKTRLLIQPWPFPGLPFNQQSYSFNLPSGYPVAWDRVAQPGMNAISTRSGQNLQTERPLPAGVSQVARAVAVMIDYPIGLNFWVHTSYSPPDATGVQLIVQNVRIELINLIDGSTGETIELAEMKVDPSRQQPWNSTPTIGSTGRRIVATYHDRLYVHDLTDDQLKKFHSPFRFIPSQTKFAVERTGTTEFQSETEGGTAPLTFNLPAPMDGMSVDESTGVVTINGERLTEALSNHNSLLEWLSPYIVRKTQDDYFESLERSIDDGIAKLTPVFEDLVGRKPSGFPVAVPVQLMAADSEGQAGSLTYHVLVEVPRESFTGRIRSMRQQQEEQMAAAHAAERAQRAQAIDGDANARLQALEEKVKAMDARIELLIQLIQGQKKP